MHITEAAALYLLRSGHSIIPIDRASKVPACAWAQYQYRPPTEAQVRDWWRYDKDLNLAVVTCAGSTGAARRLIILDYDDSELFEAHKEFLPLDTCMVQTGRKGGRHVWLLAPEPIASRRFAGLDVKALGGYCIAPPARHHSGVQYRYINGPDRVAEISWEQLAQLGLVPIGQTQSIRLRPPWMSQNAWSVVLGDGVHEPCRRSRSEHDLAALCSMVNAGATWADVRDVYSEHAGQGTKYSSLKRRSSKRAENCLRRSYAVAERYVANRVGEIHHQLNECMDSLWYMARSSYDLAAVYCALILMARKTASLEVGADLRTIAEIAGVSHTTASRHLRDLTRAAKINRWRSDSKIHAYQYVLRTGEDVNYNGAKSSILPRENCVECNNMHHFQPEIFGALMSHDLFANGALGKAGLAIWIALQRPDEWRVAVLEHAVGCSRWTVRRLLDRMRSYGMVDCEGSVYVARQSVDLEAVVVEHGLRRVGVERQLSHIADRVRFEKTLGIERPEHHRHRALFVQGVSFGHKAADV